MHMIFSKTTILKISVLLNISVLILFLYIFTIHKPPKSNFCQVDSYSLIHNKNAEMYDPIVTLLKDGKPIVNYARKTGFSLFEVNPDGQNPSDLATLMLQDRDDNGSFDAVSYTILDGKGEVRGNVFDSNKDGHDIKVVHF